MQQDSFCCPGRVRMSDNYEIKLEKMLASWLNCIVKLPWLYIIISFILCAIFTAGFALLDVQNQPEEVWIPQESESYSNRDDVEDRFGDDPQRYMIYVTSDRSEIKDLMSNEPFQHLVNFDTLFKQVDKDDITYSSICERVSKTSPCVSNEYALGFWKDVNHNINYDAETPYQVHFRIQSGRGVSPLYEEYDSHYIPTRRMFSGRLPEEMTYEASGANDIYYFEAIQYEYTIQVDEDDEDDVSDWKDELEDLVDDFNDDTNIIQVYMYSLDRVGKGLEEALTVDFGLYFGLLLFIFFYGFFIIGRCHPVYCRVPLSLALILQYLMTLFSALGFTCYIYPFVASNVYITFILALQTLLYSSFLVRSTEHYAISHTEPTNKTKAYIDGASRAGVSLLKTTIIGTIAFGLGTISDIEAIRSFCSVGACATVFNFINTMTFFVACLYYDFKRVNEEKNDCCTLCSCNPEGVIFCGGRCVLDSYANRKEPFLDVLLVERIVPMLEKTCTRIVLVVLVVLVIAIGIAGAVLVKHEFRTDWLVTDEDSQTSDAIDVRDDYFGDRGYIMNIYTTDVDFTFKSTQSGLRTLVQAMKDNRGCNKDWFYEDTVFSWYDSFNAWVGQGLCVDSNSGNVYELEPDGYIPPTFFNVCLSQWITKPIASHFVNDLYFKNGVLETARLKGRVQYIEDKDDQLQILEDLFDLADDYGPGDSYPYNTNMLYYEQAEVLYPTTWVFIAVVILLNGLVNFALSLRISSTLLSMLNNLAIVLSMFIVMWALSVEFNVVTVLHLFMVAILGAEFSTHITHAYVSRPGERHQRLAQLYKFAGSALPHVCLASFLAVIIFMIPTETYIFQAFAKIWAATLVFVFILCFLALPAFLSTVGPRSLQQKQAAVGSEKHDKDQAPWEDEMDEQHNQYDPPNQQAQEIDMYRDNDGVTPGDDGITHGQN